MTSSLSDPESLCQGINKTIIPSSTKLNKYLGLGLFIVLLIYIIFFTIWYIRRSQIDEFLKKKDRLMVLIMVTGALFNLSLAFREYQGRENYPCSIMNINVLIYFLCIGGSVVVRSLSYYFRIKLNQKLAFASWADRARQISKTQVQNQIDELSSRRLQQATFAKSSLLSQTSTNLDVVREQRANSFTGSKKSEKAETNANSTHASGGYDGYDTAFYLASRSFGVHLWSFFLLIAVFLGVLSINGYYSCYGCEIEIRQVVIVMIFSACIVPPSSYAFNTVRNEPDPFSIFFEVGYNNVIPTILFMIWLAAFFTDAGGLHSSGKLSWHYLLIVNSTIIFTGSVPYQLWLSYHPARGSGDAKLKDILNSVTGKELFKIHLARELSVENYLFYEDATKWRKLNSKEPRKQKSMRNLTRIYLLYIADHANMEINISAKTKDAIEKALFFPDDLQATILDDAISEVFHLMEDFSLPRFYRTNLYEQYLGKNDNPGSVYDVSVIENDPDYFL